MDLDTITVSDFKTQFPADFPYLPGSYSDSIYNYVQDAEITAAMTKAKVNFNQDLLDSDSSIQVAFLLASAHYLVMSVRNRLQGVQSIGQQIVSSKGAGGVNESFVIPDAFAKNPIINYYSKSGYGLEFLSMIMPSLIGGVASVYGGTRA